MRTSTACLWLGCTSNGCLQCPPRRLEYSTTRLVTPAEYAASGKTENYVVMNKRGWTWNLHSYKTMEKYGVQILAIPGPLKAALNKVKPIIDAKNDKVFF